MIHKVRETRKVIAIRKPFPRFNDNELCLVQPIYQLRAEHCSHGTPTGG
jgi:hypothetical protein